MSVHLVTFSDESMSRAAELCVESAKRNGVDDSFAWKRSALKDTEFYANNKGILDNPRGAGLWAWKPWIIGGAIDYFQFEADAGNTDDVIIYADAGVEFINNVSHIIDRMDQDIFLFGNNYEHAHWCKSDVVVEVWPWGFARRPLNSPTWHNFGKQVQASVIFFRVSDYTRRFVKEWLDWCLFEGGRLIDDSPSRSPYPNHPEFQEHRHDQAILTTMAYRDGLRLHYWPATYNDGAFNYEKLPEYAGDSYPILFHHHRRRNVDWSAAA